MSPDRVSLHIEATDKDAIIRELVDLLDQAPGLNDRPAVEQAILEREAEMSTGLHNGVAIPHGKSDAVDQLQAAIGLKPEGVDFDCVDGQPATIFVCMVSPTSQTGPHIRFMAEISRLLRQEEVRAKLLGATTAEEVLQLLEQ